MMTDKGDQEEVSEKGAHKGAVPTDREGPKVAFKEARAEDARTKTKNTRTDQNNCKNQGNHKFGHVRKRCSKRG